MSNHIKIFTVYGESRLGVELYSAWGLTVDDRTSQNINFTLSRESL
jgi:hypothetical protein